MIGNPPWEGINFKSAEFFGRFDPSYSLLKRADVTNYGVLWPAVSWADDAVGSRGDFRRWFAALV
jgi:hypothetical protein